MYFPFLILKLRSVIRGFMPKETILILDNDRYIIWAVKTLLENEGFITIAVDTIERALKNFSEFEISGFITEYRIGQNSTLEAIQKLKSLFPETYVMMITIEELKEGEYEEIMQAGVDDYFLKPLSINKILIHLRKGMKYRSIALHKNRLEKERYNTGVKHTNQTL
jgi:DNA-binding NtrC family response regulator